MTLRHILFATSTSLALAAGLAAHADSTGSASLTARVSTDSNLFLQDDAPLAAGQTVPALPADASTVLATVGVNLGWKWTPDATRSLELGYAPELFRYRDFSKENHTDHRFSVAATGRTADSAWRYEAKANWLVVDGANDTPTFNRLGGGPAVGGEPVRARRSQDTLKASGRITRTLSAGFIRGGFALVHQNFHTLESTTPGCANYVDRGEWTVGPEAGWNVRPGLALVAAVRGGRQIQADLLGVNEHYSSTLTRWLVGAEGTLTKTLKVNFLVGPDVRRFDGAVRAGFDRHATSTYAEANATWTATSADTLTLAGKQYVWFSGGGRGVYVDVLADLGWKHTFSKTWDASALASYHLGRTGEFNLKSPRDDTIYLLSANVGHALTPSTRVELSYSYDWSVSRVPLTPAREYHRRIASLSCTRRW